TAAAVPLALLALLGSITVRYGNESFEQVRPADLNAVQWVYSHSQPGDTLIALTPNLPWRYRDIETYDYVGPIGVPTTLKEILALAPGHGAHDGYLIVTPGEDAYGKLWYGLSDDWVQRLTDQLRFTQRATVVYRADGATIYRLRGTAA